MRLQVPKCKTINKESDKNWLARDKEFQGKIEIKLIGIPFFVAETLITVAQK